MKIDGCHIEFEYYDTLGGTPASCKIITPYKKAIIKIARDQFAGYDYPTRLFIILHEIGHAVLNTGCEKTVDRWAFKQFAKTNNKLKGSVFALSRVLNPVASNEHSERVKNQFYRAKHQSFINGDLSFKKFKKLKV